LTIKAKAYIAGIYEHPTRHAPDKSTAQLHAEVAKGAIEETYKEVEKRFDNIKPSEPAEFKTENGIKFLERDYTGKDKGSPRTLAILAFSVDKQTYFAIFQAGTPEADKKYTEEVAVIVKSITAIKGDSDDD